MRRSQDLLLALPAFLWDFWALIWSLIAQKSPLSTQKFQFLGISGWEFARKQQMILFMVGRRRKRRKIPENPGKSWMNCTARLCWVGFLFNLIPIFSVIHIPAPPGNFSHLRDWGTFSFFLGFFLQIQPQKKQDLHPDREYPTGTSPNSRGINQIIIKDPEYSMGFWGTWQKSSLSWAEKPKNLGSGKREKIPCGVWKMGKIPVGFGKRGKFHLGLGNEKNSSWGLENRENSIFSMFSACQSHKAPNSSS